MPIHRYTLAFALIASLLPARDVLAESGGRSLAEDRSSDERSTPGPAGTLFQADIGVGYRALDLTTFEARRRAGGTSLTADLVPNDMGGPEATVAAGFRVFFLTLGLRGTVAHFEDRARSRTVDGMDLYTIDAELGLNFLQIGRFVPGVVFGGGYAVFGGLEDALAGPGQGLDIDGANARFALTLDYYVSPVVSIGARAGVEALFLSRPGVPIRDLTSFENVDSASRARALVLRADGSSVGTALFLGVGPSLHF